MLIYNSGVCHNQNIIDISFLKTPMIIPIDKQIQSVYKIHTERISYLSYIKNQRELLILPQLLNSNQISELTANGGSPI